MGYEGHLMAVEDRGRQRTEVAAAMARLRAAHDDVGGDIVSAGGTGTYDLHDATGVNEVQAGSYALMDTAYAKLGLPFEQALFVVGTVISVRPGHAVADVGLKALGMDHGNPAIAGGDGVVLQRRARDVRARRPAPGRRRPGPRRARPRRPDDGHARGRLARRRRRRSSTAGPSTCAAGDEAHRRIDPPPSRLGVARRSPAWPSPRPARGSRACAGARHGHPLADAVGRPVRRPARRRAAATEDTAASPSPPASSARPAWRWRHRSSCAAPNRRPTPPPSR